MDILTLEDHALIRRIAAEAEVSHKTLIRHMRGLPLRPLSEKRITRVLDAHGIRCGSGGALDVSHNNHH